jgi:hypothetical protein
VPDNDAGSDRDIHGMFGAKLWNFKTPIADIDDFLMNTLYFIT